MRMRSAMKYADRLIARLIDCMIARICVTHFYDVSDWAALHVFLFLITIITAAVLESLALSATLSASTEW